jgi:hypothetical protein
MSTKIYDGYRFPRNRLDEFIPLFNRICLKSVNGLLKKYRINDKTIRETRKKLCVKNRIIRKVLDDNDICLIFQLVEWMKMSKKGMKDIFHLDCSFNLWLDGKWAYMIPYVACGMKMEKLLPGWCEYYGYWNNTDRPDDVSLRDWNARGRTWNKVALDDWDRTRLTHIVFEMKMPNLIGLNNVLRSIRNDEDWISRIYMAASMLYWNFEEKQLEDQKNRV